LPLSVLVELGGRPLEKAAVVFEPESFMGAGLQSYEGVSDSTGSVYLQGQSQAIPGLPLGLYRVRITRAAGGGEVVQGCEVAEDNQSGSRLVFSL